MHEDVVAEAARKQAVYAESRAQRYKGWWISEREEWQARKELDDVGKPLR